MIESLDEALRLAGRWDGGAGYDAPRQRFRRFLRDHVTTAETIRSYIEQCRYQVDEQHDQALRDLVIAAGQPLGFECTFGANPSAGATADGYWRSRAHRLETVLQVRTNHSPASDGASLVKSVTARTAVAGGDAATTVVGLCVVSPLYPGTARLEAWLAGSADPRVRIRVLSLRSLLVLTDLVAGGQLGPGEIAQLLESVTPLDFVAGLLAGPPRRSPSHERAGPSRWIPDTAPGCWLATVAGDYALTPERFLEVVVGRRRLYGVPATTAGAIAAQPGDRICFYVSGRGAVGRADVAAVEPKAAGLRDVSQYKQVLRLENIEIHVHAPKLPDSETTLRLRVTQGDGKSAWQPFMRIPPQDFRALAGARESDRQSSGFRVETGAVAPKTDGGPGSINGAGSLPRE